MATTTVAASSGGANAKGKLVGKDYITLAIFGVLLFLVFMVFAMVLGMNANLFWFTHACGSLIGGIVWMYVAAKVPKRGAFAIMSAIVAVVALLLGMHRTTLTRILCRLREMNVLGRFTRHELRILDRVRLEELAGKV